jgi:hypothetical protein
MDIQIARTIQQQIGNRAFVMIGAYGFMAYENGLEFSFKGSKRCNVLRIQLQPDDTYTLTFCKRTPFRISAKGAISGGTEPVASEANVYCSQLCDMIRHHTGLYTSL